LPHLIDELPLFHGLLIDSAGREIGVITEDFTQGGKLSIRQAHDDSDQPEEIYNLIGGFAKPYDQTTSFIVNGRRMIGDLGDLVGGFSVLKPNAYTSRMADYTIMLSGQ